MHMFKEMPDELFTLNYRLYFHKVKTNFTKRKQKTKQNKQQTTNKKKTIKKQNTKKNKTKQNKKQK